MNNRICAFSASHECFDWTESAVRSFLTHNPTGWQIRISDIGLSDSEKCRLATMATIIDAERDNSHAGVYLPAAKARIKMLEDLEPGDTLLYIDSDSLILRSVEPIVEAFECSNKPIGIIAEDQKRRFSRQPAYMLWRARQIPRADFPRQLQWYTKPMLNTGVLLAQGPQAVNLAKRAFSMYDRLRPLMILAEQTILCSLIYELEMDVFELPLQFHCFVWEDFITHQGAGQPYNGQEASIDGQPIIIRHFAGMGVNKEVLSGILQARSKCCL